MYLNTLLPESFHYIVGNLSYLVRVNIYIFSIAVCLAELFRSIFHLKKSSIFGSEKQKVN